MFHKKVLLEISQNSQENTCVRFSFFNKVAGLRKFAKFLKTPFSYRTPPVAVYEKGYNF